MPPKAVKDPTAPKAPKPKKNVQVKKLTNFTLSVTEDHFLLSIQSSDTLKKLAEKKYLHDVSVEANDGCIVTANKCVLATRSEFFQKLFKKRPEISNVLLLCFDGYELVQMIRLIYGYQIQVKKTNLDALMANKNLLGIK